MSESENKEGKFGEPSKIRPRQMSKAEVEAEEAEERKRRRLLEKKADDGWLSRLKPADKVTNKVGDTPEPAAKPPVEKPEERPEGKSEVSQKTTENKPDLEVGKVSEFSEKDEWKDDEPTDKPQVSPVEKPDEASESEDSSGRRKRRTKKKAPGSGFRRMLAWGRQRWIFLVCFVLTVGLLSLLFFRWGEELGYQRGLEINQRTQAIVESKKVLELPEEARKRFDEALLEIREGDVQKAADTLQALTTTFPDVPSLDYAAALAAIQAGDWSRAERFAKLSIEKNERVSDSFVLLSIVESSRGAENPNQQFGDTKLRVRQMLEKAIAADPMNSGARMEYGSLLRYSGDEQGAVRELRAAKARLHPVDSHLAVDVTVGLIEVENLPKEALTPSEPNSEDVRVLIPAAYIALKHDDFDLGVRLLKRAQNLITPDMFFYLVNDRAFRRFSYHPEIRTLQGE